MKITSEDALPDVLKTAKTPLCIRGGGTRGFGVAGDILDMSAMSRISLYEPGALTMVVQAGTPIATIEEALAKEKQRLPFEPMDHRGLLGTKGKPTIGGVMAANVSGPRRIAVGAARDFALGVRFVDGTGSIIKNGGRVMKNVTGYDLVKLMCGSYGTLGVLTEIALKVLPTPETQSTLVLHGLSAKAAVTAMANALGSPFEVTGASHFPQLGTALRLEGFEASVKYRVQRLRDLLNQTGAEFSVLDEEASIKIWQNVRDVAPFHAQNGDVWRVSCKPSDGPALAEKANPKDVLFDWAGGLIWLRTETGYDVRTRLGAFGGHATLIRADAATGAALGVFQPASDGVARLTAGLRAKFDPRGIFNAGLMG